MDFSDLNLVTLKMCSPIIGFIIYVIVSGISLYITRSKLKRYGNQKMENLYNLHSWNEIKFIIVFGVILYGLCQYDQINVAWLFLLVPLIYLVLRNLLIFYYITIAHQNAPKEDKDTEKENNNNNNGMSLLPAPPIVKKEVNTSIFGMRGDPESPNIPEKPSLPPTPPISQTNIENLTSPSHPVGGPSIGGPTDLMQWGGNGGSVNGFEGFP